VTRFVFLVVLRIISIVLFCFGLWFLVRSIKSRPGSSGHLRRIGGWTLLSAFSLAAFLLLPALASNGPADTHEPSQTLDPAVVPYMPETLDEYGIERAVMLKEQIISRGVSRSSVLEAIGHVPRHLFVPSEIKDKAYYDHPLPIGEGQTISQPYVVALMTELLNIKSGDAVLEIGTGSGYQAAVLAEITDRVYSIEIKENLVSFARRNLENAGYTRVQIKHDDGYFGWEEEAPFDAIIVTCAANHVPQPLIHQLKDKGRLVIPLGDVTFYQTLTVITKWGEDLRVQHVSEVAFVPMTGEAQSEQTNP
jgi:protein-L-isoaspartate(D-aspartate) O-methyltransferase